MSLNIHNLHFAYPGKDVLHDISLINVPKGELTVLLGPNAAGKSTLFRCLSGLLTAQSGQVELGARTLHSLTREERFRAVCYMPQTFASQARLSVFEVILLSRKSLAAWRVNADDMAVVDKLLRDFGIEHLAQRQISELSGGQQQLVSLCQAMAREPELFLLDEPTSALDLGRQLSVLQRLKQEMAQRQVVTIVALHDLALAVRFADRVIVMDEGKIRAFGQTEDIFRSGIIAQTYGVEIELLQDGQGRLVVAAG